MSTNSPPFTSSDPVVVSSSSPVVVLSSAKSTDNNGLPLTTGSNDVRSAFGCQNATGVLSDQGNITRLLSSDSSVIPEVPAIPSELMIPPRVARHSISPFVGEKAAVGDLSVGAGSSRVDVGKLQDNIDSMRTHLGRQVGTLTEIQNQLTVRAHELERVRAELKEHGEMEQRAALMKHPLPSGRPTGPPYIDSVTSGSTAGILSGLATKTFATATPNVGITGTEHEIRELRAQTEDLRSRLILTTNLCTKQETYYRDIIVELENRLKETIAGRDHVLALREAESGNQLQLMQQLESALTKQQGMNSHKEEVLHSYETKLLVLEDNVKNTELIVDKFVQLVHEEEKKRGRTGFMSDSRVSGTPSARIVGQSAAQALQRCLLEDEGDKQLLRAKLTRVEGELAELKQLAESRHSEQQKSHEKHVSKLEDNRKQVIESASLKQEETKKELCHLQEELAKLRKEQTAELATRDRRVTSLELELETVKRQKSEAVHALENKCRTIEETEREVRTELELLQGEKARLMTAVSQEQAKNINLNEKLSQTEQHLDKEKQGHNKLDEEYRTLQDSSAEEIKRLQAELKKQDEILKETNEKLMAEQVAEVEAVKQEEREKSNTRLDGILQELNKMNEHVSQLRTDLDLKNNEVQSLNLDTLKQKEQLDLQEKEICVVRQNVIDFVQKLEEKESELRRAKEEIAQFTQTNEEMAENLKTAENSNEKLQTQLEEREKTIQTFKQQGASLAEILEKNNKNGDSLQREREQLVQKLQETISQVEEMKKHREILARKLKAKDKRTKELEEENEVVGKQLKAKKEELAAMMNDREGIMAEVKMRQREVTELRDERNTLSALLEGRDGEKEKEINKLLSRLKGSEQDLNLTRKLLKTKRDISGKAVRVAESMQKEVTCKRGEVDTLQSKLHWMTESLESAVKDKKYFENKCKSLSADLNEVTQRRDQLEYELQYVAEQSGDLRGQVKHLEQALEKAALKHADSQAVIEKLEQDIARLKLKHSLEIKEVYRNQKTAYPLVRPDAAAIFSELFTRSAAAGFRFPIVSSHAADKHILGPLLEDKVGQIQCSKQKEEVSGELKSLLQDMRTLINSFQGHATHAATQAQNLGPHEQVLPQTNNCGPLLKHDVAANVLVSQAHQQSEERIIDGKNTRKTPLEGKPFLKEQNLIKETRRNNDGSHSDESDSLKSEPDIGNENVVEEPDMDFTAPLHSSSPKQVVSRQARSHKNNARHTAESVSPPSVSGNINDSEVTSLLFSDRPKSANSEGSHDQRFAPSLSSAFSVSRLSSGQQSVASDISNMGTEPSWPRREGQRLLRTDDESRKRNANVGTPVRYKDDSLSQKPVFGQVAIQPAHEKAEKMLQLLAQTGNKLTKTNKEIETLLKEQDKKIKKCRKKERKIEALSHVTKTQRRNIHPQR